MICKTCKEDLPGQDFWARQVECKKCSRARNQKWVNANREHYRALNLAATRRYRTKDPRQRLLDYCQRRSAKTGTEFSLTVDDIEWPEICPALGIPLLYGMGSRGQRGPGANSASLDRIDNDKGYVKGNVVVVSWRANRFKCDATIDELIKLARFYSHVGRKGAPQGGKTRLSGM